MPGLSERLRSCQGLPKQSYLEHNFSPWYTDSGTKHWSLAKTIKKPIAFILEVLSPVYAWLVWNFLYICASDPKRGRRWRLGRPGDASGARKANAKLNNGNNATAPNKDLTYSPCIIHILGTSVLWYSFISSLLSESAYLAAKILKILEMGLTVLHIMHCPVPHGFKAGASICLLMDWNLIKPSDLGVRWILLLILATFLVSAGILYVYIYIFI